MTPKLFGETVALAPVIVRDSRIFGTFAPQLNELALARLYFGKGFEHGFGEMCAVVKQRLARLG